MGVVLFVFIWIAVAVVAAAYLYFKHAKISDACARKVEVVGYILLLVIIIWEFVVKNIMFESFYNADFLYINQKLLHIYSAVASLIDGGVHDTVTGWKSFTGNESSDYVKTQLLTVNIIEAVLQIASAVCIAVGRFQELRGKKSTE